MNTITLRSDSDAALEQIITLAKKLKVAIQIGSSDKGEEAIQRIPGIPYTYEQLKEDIRCSEEEIKAGQGILHDDLVKEIRSW